MKHNNSSAVVPKCRRDNQRCHLMWILHLIYCLYPFSLSLSAILICLSSISVAGEPAHFEIQYKEKPGKVTWLKDNKALDDVLADRVIQTEAPMNSYRLDIKNCR